MPIGLLKEIAHVAPKNRALLGIDVGSKTLGLALSDPAHRLATPFKTITRTKFSKDMQALAPMIAEFEIGGFVIGLPVQMDGSEGRRAQSIRDFALEMKNYPDIIGADPWVALWDERLSTVSVEEFVDNTVEKRKTRVEAKSSGLIDKLAAQQILQGALDYLNNN
jgi:putative Holliday junction resolvase